MKTISIQDLKSGLSAALSEVTSGKVLVITKHNHPVAQLIPAHHQHVHRGAKVGQGEITPALRRGTKGSYVSTLLEDRSDR
jgi:prevent-host-death family protein